MTHLANQTWLKLSSDNDILEAAFPDSDFLYRLDLVLDSRLLPIHPEKLKHRDDGRASKGGEVHWQHNKGCVVVRWVAVQYGTHGWVRLTNELWCQREVELPTRQLAPEGRMGPTLGTKLKWRIAVLSRGSTSSGCTVSKDCSRDWNTLEGSM